MPRRAQAIPVAVSLLLAAGLQAVASPAGAAGTREACITDGPYASSGAATQVCLSVPDTAQLSGVVTVTATISNVGQPTTPLSAFGARRLEFTLDGAPLLTDYAAPYTFELPTDTFVDGQHTLEVSALLRDSFTDAVDTQTPPASLAVDFANGVDEVLPNPDTFTPTGGRPAAAGEPFVVAATGDGASGEPQADAVSDLIDGWDPNLFLYLGDVYEDGTPTEFYNWYGTPGATRWGRFLDVTHPTLGNHEVDNGVATGYDGYFGNPADYYSFDANGWHFAQINSNSYFAQTEPGTAQYEWLKEDLATSAAACTVVYLHHPVWSIGGQGSTESLAAVWDLLVDSGVDMVLTGHDHNYQRWQPLDADGVPSQDGPTHFVLGAGGHGVRPFTSSDSRVAVGLDSFQAPDARGSLRMTLGATAAGYEYVNWQGQVLDSGSVTCSVPPVVVTTFKDRIVQQRDDLTALLATVGSSDRDKIRSAITHLDEALAPVLWSSDERPADKDGHKVVEELKKAVEELENASGSAAIKAAVTSLTDIGMELSAAAIAEAVASYADLSEVQKARTEYAEGLAKLSEGKHKDALDKFTKAFEHARKALEKAPDAWVSGVGARGRIGDVLADVYAMVPTRSSDSELTSAVEELREALDTQYWVGESRPAIDSDAKVPDRLKKAVEQLAKAEVNVKAQMVELVDVSRLLAQDAVADAKARRGKSSYIAEAEKEIAEGSSALTRGLYVDAADLFKKAFEKARSA